MADHLIGTKDALLKDGEMTRLELEGKAVVIARVGDEYYAFGANCSHYGAPLDEGVLTGHSVICPWHHACFDIRNGVRLEPPALNDIAHYPVRIEQGQICVSLPSTNEREPQGKRDGSDPRVFVIVGGGAAGNAAAEELRRAGYRGSIIMLSADPTVPVDRPNLSKDYLEGAAQPDWIPLRSPDWYTTRDIDLRLGTRVTQLDPAQHLLTLENGESLQYDKLLLATGAVPRRFRHMEGGDLDGIFTLRTLADCDRIIEASANGQHVVIIGASFIGMEAAAALVRGRQAQVTIIGVEAVPFEHTLGERIGRMFQQEHIKNGVQFRLSSEVSRFLGENGRVTGVELKGGEVISADYVILGIGVQPATDFLQDTGIELDKKDKSVRVNAQLQTNDHDIYAAGDIARWTNGSQTGTRIEHWRTAQQQGIVAARNMLGLANGISDRIPFFWTHQFDIELRYVGHASDWDEMIYRHGTPDTGSFAALYLKNGRLVAAAGVNRDQEMDAVEIILRDKMPITPTQLRDDSFDLVAFARGLTSR